jgi:NADPH-dependent glutamate synthase beta subunit-like oxidoreductase/coenzyme F420-reducing hydrogenase delta subunit/NAD-dependent dihydropyrimidine dehydrogenase PreA subunit
LIEANPFLGKENIGSEDKGGLNTRLLELLKHPNITVWANTTLRVIEDAGEQFRVELSRQPRYVDLSVCTACGKCVEVCPVTVPGAERKAIYLDGQPGCMAIDKAGRSPCASACPSGVHVQGYVALINQGRYQEAIDLIREVLPFPSVCGRVCNHQCEAACSRGQIDSPVNIMALKRFAADWWFVNQKQLPKNGNGQSEKRALPSSGKRVAIIGAGPAGLTAARDLVRVGHDVKVFDALPVAGGMMRVGIPPHRLPSHLLDWEIQLILDEGVELELNTYIDDIPGLLDRGYDAVLIATGAQKAKKLPLPNSEHPGNWLSLDFLREARMGAEGRGDSQIDLTGKSVLVLGGGNVALDSARVAVRLRAKEVRVACLEPRGEMPGFDWEIEVAEEEGVQICPGRTFKEIVLEEEKIIGVRCAEVEFRGFVDGHPDIDEREGTEHILPADIVIWAIGQQSDLSFLPGDDRIQTVDGRSISSDSDLMTSMPGIFVAGDVHRGVTFFVVDAIGEGHKAARSIDRYLLGGGGLQEPADLPVIELDQRQINSRLETSKLTLKPRIGIPSLSVEDRRLNFNEVDLPLKEDQAQAESSRCLSCGPCSECMACVQVCTPNAINHDQLAETRALDVGAVIVAVAPNVLQDAPIVQSEGVYWISPEDEIAGSAAAASTLRYLGRKPLLTSVPTRSNLSFSNERIGIFVCECGEEVSDIIDLQMVCDQAKNWPGVVVSKIVQHACLPSSAEGFRETLITHNLDRVILASCSCCAIDQVCSSCTYQRVRNKNNLGVFSRNGNQGSVFGGFSNFEFVNIREQCAWVHSDDPAGATAKTLSLIKAAASKEYPRTTRGCDILSDDLSVLILGDGRAAPICAQTLSELGISAHRLAGDISLIRREEGQYVVNSTHQASSLVLAPSNQQEERTFVVALNRGQNGSRDVENYTDLMPLPPGVVTCDRHLDPLTSSSAAASRVTAWLSSAAKRSSQNHAVVDPNRCRACGTCIALCEIYAPSIVEGDEIRSAWIDPIVCAGCGVCVAHCPTGAISSRFSVESNLENNIAGVIDQAEREVGQLRIIAFGCNWNALSSLEDAGANRFGFPPNIIPLRVGCLGEISSGSILKTFAHGVDGILMVGCLTDECHYHFGSISAEQVFSETKDLVSLLGYRDEQFRLLRIAKSDGKTFAHFVNEWYEELVESFR